MTADKSESEPPWAIVTGASSGIGEAFAHALAGRGLRPLLIARRENELRRVAAQIEARHSIDCEWLALDLADSDFIDALEEMTHDRDIAMVVGNAAVNPLGAFAHVSRDELMQVLDINDRANILLADAFLPKLEARGAGGFIMIASTEAMFGVPYSACYSASKAFVLNFGEALWGEYLDTGVDVLVVLPGATDTPLLASRDLGETNMTILSPECVVESALAYLGKGPTIVPGLRNRWTQRFMRRLPRTWMIRKLAPLVRAMVERSSSQIDQRDRNVTAR